MLAESWEENSNKDGYWSSHYPKPWELWAMQFREFCDLRRGRNMEVTPSMERRLARYERNIAVPKPHSRVAKARASQLDADPDSVQSRASGRSASANVAKKRASKSSSKAVSLSEGATGPSGLDSNAKSANTHASASIADAQSVLEESMGYGARYVDLELPGRPFPLDGGGTWGNPDRDLADLAAQAVYNWKHDQLKAAQTLFEVVLEAGKGYFQAMLEAHAVLMYRLLTCMIFFLRPHRDS